MQVDRILKTETIEMAPLYAKGLVAELASGTGKQPTQNRDTYYVSRGGITGMR